MNLSRFLTVLATGCLLIPTANVIAQDVQVQESVDLEVVGDQEGGAPIVISATQSSDGNGGTAMRIMSADLSGGGSLPMLFAGDNMAMSFQMGAPDGFNMLQNPSVQKDLELVDDQLQKINDIQKEFNDKMKGHLEGLRLGNKDSALNLGETIKELKAAQQSQIESLLLDHQRTRLQQITLQTHMKNSGTAGALADAKWAELLGISDEQKKRMTEKAKELKEERKEKIAKLDADIKKRLLDELTPEQRKKLDELTGDKYESKSEDWRERFQQRSQRTPKIRRQDNK